jgi:hypothetical protein
MFTNESDASSLPPDVSSSLCSFSLLPTLLNELGAAKYSNRDSEGSTQVYGSFSVLLTCRVQRVHHLFCLHEFIEKKDQNELRMFLFVDSLF